MRLIDADAIPWFIEGIGDIPVITKEEIDEMPTIEAVSASELKAMEKELNYYRNLAESYERTILALTDAIGRKDGNEQTD